MPDIAFVADGFNLYHSVTDASKDLTNQAYQALLATGSLGLMLPVGTRWLDMNSLFASYRANIASGVAFKPGFHTQSVYYFSALAHHMERSSPGTVNRHLSYIQCLEATGVVPKLARFKSKFIRCDLCSGRLERHEEKETDVLVALQLIKLALDQKNPVKAIALVSGDTDYAPALRLVREMNPSVFLACLFPYKRKNRELARLVDFSIDIPPAAYVAHQFADPFTLQDGTQIAKPANW